MSQKKNPVLSHWILGKIFESGKTVADISSFQSYQSTTPKRIEIGNSPLRQGITTFIIPPKNRDGWEITVSWIERY